MLFEERNTLKSGLAFKCFENSSAPELIGNTQNSKAQTGESAKFMLVLILPVLPSKYAPR
jgi:hypothetical protein